MRNRNIDFQEQYKRLDNLCKDCYSSSTGVTEYINRMDESSFQGRHYIDNWDNTYRQLKHIRWIRNQLAHEPGTFDSDICSKEDVEFIASFYDKMMNSIDPLSALRTKINRQTQKNNQQNQISRSIPKKTDEKSSLLKRIFNKLKALFH